MTTIVCTRSAIYADSHAGGHIPHGSVKIEKVTHGEEEYLVGFAGYFEEGYILRKLLAEHGLDNIWRLHLPSKDGKDQMPEIMKDDDFNTDLLIVTQDKRILQLSKYLAPVEILSPNYAIGSGSQWATAAMDHGKSAKEAIEYAATRDPHTKAPIHTLTFRTRT
jgi:ATP-dependent protease HslVU (ClpYQ) peptidase subunit